jgi:hypothetical protein
MMSGSAVLAMSYMLKSVLRLCLEPLTLLVKYSLDVAFQVQWLQQWSTDDNLCDCSIVDSQEASK